MVPAAAVLPMALRNVMASICRLPVSSGWGGLLVSVSVPFSSMYRPSYRFGKGHACCTYGCCAVSVNVAATSAEGSLIAADAFVAAVKAPNARTTTTTLRDLPIGLTPFGSARPPPRGYLAHNWELGIQRTPMVPDL